MRCSTSSATGPAPRCCAWDSSPTSAAWSRSRSSSCSRSWCSTRCCRWRSCAGRSSAPTTSTSSTIASGVLNWSPPAKAVNTAARRPRGRSPGRRSSGSSSRSRWSRSRCTPPARVLAPPRAGRTMSDLLAALAAVGRRSRARRSCRCSTPRSTPWSPPARSHPALVPVRRRGAGVRADRRQARALRGGPAAGLGPVARRHRSATARPLGRPDQRERSAPDAAATRWCSPRPRSGSRRSRRSAWPPGRRANGAGSSALLCLAGRTARFAALALPAAWALS